MPAVPRSDSPDAIGVLWERDLHQLAHRTVIDSTVVLASERHTKLCRVSPVDGATIWVANVRGPFGWVGYSGATCVYLNQHSFLQAFDIHDGTERWAVELAGPHPSIFGWPVVCGQHVVVGGWRGYTDLVALRVEDGAVAWRKAARGGALTMPRRGPADTLLLAFPTEARSELIDAATGHTVRAWGCPAAEVLPDSTPFAVHAGGRFLCLGSGGGVFQLDPERDEGWSQLARHAAPIRSFAPAVVESLVVFEDERGLLCAYSLEDGVQRWEAPVEHRRRDILPVAALPDGGLAFGSASGLLEVFDGAGRTVARRAMGKRFVGGMGRTATGEVVAAVGGRLVGLRLAMR